MPRGSGLMKKNISFKKVKNITLGKLFGTKKLAAADMMKILWKLIKKKKLQKKAK